MHHPPFAIAQRQVRSHGAFKSTALPDGGARADEHLGFFEEA